MNAFIQHPFLQIFVYIEPQVFLSGAFCFLLQVKWEPHPLKDVKLKSVMYVSFFLFFTFSLSLFLFSYIFYHYNINKHNISCRYGVVGLSLAFALSFSFTEFITMGLCDKCCKTDFENHPIISKKKQVHFYLFMYII